MAANDVKCHQEESGREIIIFNVVEEIELSCLEVAPFVENPFADFNCKLFVAGFSMPENIPKEN